jgi:threonine/homoserine/homoserine lactone efflux protein
MNQIIEFAFTVILISASGVMMPGPLFTANIAYGLQGVRRAGIKMAIGHTIVELPLVILLGVGVFSFEIFPEFRTIISIVGAIVLFVFAGIQIKTTLQTKEKTPFNLKHNAIITGIILSAVNPFFIIWWLSIGLKLISDAMLIWSFVGIFVVFVFHIWMDFVWLYSTGRLASKSLKILSNKNYKILMIGLSVMLTYFGILFIVDIV